MEGDVLQLTLPAKSIFGKEEGDNRPLQAYARFLLAQTPNPVDPSEVVTRLNIFYFTIKHTDKQRVVSNFSGHCLE